MTGPPADQGTRWRRRALTVLGAGIGLAALGWLLRGLDYDRLITILASADPAYLLLVPLAVVVEQLVRAWKWGRLLDVLRGVDTWRLFGATMAGHLANLLAPVGVSPLVRAWLVARHAGLTMSAVLATIVVDRVIDGIVFVGLVVVVLLFAVIPDPSGDIRLGLALGGIGSLVLLVPLVFALRRQKRQIARGAGWLLRLAGRLPARLVGRSQAFLLSFSDGVVWPRETWRRVAVVAASMVVKLVAATHLLWAGLAFDVVLRPFDYLFLVVLLGFLTIITHLARVPGGFLVGAVFALKPFGVGEEQAFAMATVVIASNLAVIGVAGLLTLWRNGIALADLRPRKKTDADDDAPRTPPDTVPG